MHIYDIYKIYIWYISTYINIWYIYMICMIYSIYMICMIYIYDITYPIYIWSHTIFWLFWCFRFFCYFSCFVFFFSCCFRSLYMYTHAYIYIYIVWIAFGLHVFHTISWFQKNQKQIKHILTYIFENYNDVYYKFHFLDFWTEGYTVSKTMMIYICICNNFHFSISRNHRKWFFIQNVFVHFWP